MTNPWTAELGRLALLAGAGLALGLVFGALPYFLLLALLAYLLQLMVQVYRLERWLRMGSSSSPEPTGVALEIRRHIERMQAQSRERQRKLADMMGRFQEATTAMPEGTVVTNTRGEIQWFNDAASRLLGLRTGKDVGQLIENLVRQPIFVQYLAAERFSEPVDFPSPLDASRRLQVQVTSYGDGQRLMVVRDVTRLHRLEQVRRDFVANVSHELRTPLTVIAGYLETMRDDTDNDIQRAWGPMVGAMQEQAGRMAQIVEDLLLLARLESEDGRAARDAVSVPSLLAAITEDAQRLSGEKRHKFVLDARSDLWLRGSELELRSAFTNLVINAVRYTPPGGTIRLQWRGDAQGAKLDVIDNGIGIAAHHIPRLTERFYRVDVGRSRNVGGTGLGLAIVKHVLGRHHARLEIDSRPGEGSRFTCHFPAESVIIQGERAQSPDA